MHITKAVVSFVIVIALAVGSGTAGAQESISSALKNPYVQALFKVLDRWDTKDLIIAKGEVEKDFMAALKRRKEKPIYAFERRKDYISRMTSRWKNLPEKLVPQLRLGVGSRMLMAGAVFDQREELVRVVKKPRELLERLRMEFFLTLGAGQMEAMAQKRKDISVPSILRGYNRFTSLPWPFCCSGMKR